MADYIDADTARKVIESVPRGTVSWETPFVQEALVAMVLDQDARITALEKRVAAITDAVYGDGK